MKANSSNDSFYLKSIKEEILKIEKFVKGETFKTFSGNDEKQYAVFKACENIGEAVKHISAGLKHKHSDIPWKEIAGFRDILSHDYFGVDITEVWKIVSQDIPKLKKQITPLIKTAR